MPVDYLQKILTAQRLRRRDRDRRSSSRRSLSRRLGNRVLLKREDQQPVFSFKLRGAYNKMAHLDAAERARGVIAASAGNHAQGVALAAQRLGCAATIVMPVTTPHIKIAAVEARGATRRAARRLVLATPTRTRSRCRTRAAPRSSIRTTIPT